MARESVWNNALENQLRLLWDAGEPTKDIADDLHMTKGQITGKALRMGLERRPSPILPAPINKPVVVNRAPKVTLPKLKLVISIEIPLEPVPSAAPPPPAPVKFDIPSRSPSRCEWREGSRPYLRCEATAQPYRSDGSYAPEGACWCPDHRAKVYVTIPRYKSIMSGFSKTVFAEAGD